MMTMATNAHLTIGRIPHFLRLKFILPNIIKPTHYIEFENQFYKLKTANTLDEVRQALRLRYEVFYKEFSSKRAPHQYLPYDIDHFDFNCDHLIIKDKENDKVIACYRLLPPEQQSLTDPFYSDHEFNLDPIRELKGRRLELGRACVHSDYRQGQVISMLWKGLYQYAKKAQVQFLFGCSSVTSNELPQLPELMATLKERNAFLESPILPRPNYHLAKFPHVNKLLERTPLASSERPRMAPLLGMYLLAGAKISSVPAYDQEFGCLDFFTILEMDKISPAFLKRWNA